MFFVIDTFQPHHCLSVTSEHNAWIQNICEWMRAYARAARWRESIASRCLDMASSLQTLRNRHEILPQRSSWRRNLKPCPPSWRASVPVQILECECNWLCWYPGSGTRDTFGWSVPSAKHTAKLPHVKGMVAKTTRDGVSANSYITWAGIKHWKDKIQRDHS